MNKEIISILNESSIFTLREFGAFIGVSNSSGIKKEELIQSIVCILDEPTPKEGRKKGRKHMTGLRGLLDKLATFKEFQPLAPAFNEYNELESDAKNLLTNYQTNLARSLTAEDSPLIETKTAETKTAETERTHPDASELFEEDATQPQKPFVDPLKEFFENNTPKKKVETAEVAQPEQKECEGYLEIIPNKGFGFIRTTEFDVYVSEALIKKMCLKVGDYVRALYSERQAGKNAAFYIKSINQKSVDDSFKRIPFENLQATFPSKKLALVSDDNAIRAIDLFSPIGKGQRGLIVSPPKAGKTTIIKNLAKAIQAGNPEMKIFILLIDERPEEVTDMKMANCGEVVFSAFDDAPERHIRIANALLEKAKRLVEGGKDVCILLDSLTRFARAVNMSVTSSSRSLSGGMDANALQTVKTFFGSGRNTLDGGSLTLIATALVDTNSRMDDLIFEEFKGTGNMELVLSRALSEQRIFPSINIEKSGTRRDEMLFTPEDYKTVTTLRKFLLTKSKNSMESLIDLFDKVKTNEELLVKLPIWFKNYENKNK